MTSLAICGLGNIGLVHLDNLLSLRGCSVRAVFDTRVGHCEAIAAKYGLDSYRRWDSLLANPEIDAVIIATPTESHRELACRALEAGKHVFLEKPLADSQEDSQAIARAWRESNRVVQVGFCERFNPQYNEAKRAVESGAIGTVRAIHSSRVAPYSLGNPNWILGVLDTAVHNFDLILWIMQSKPLRVEAHGVQVYPDSAIPHSVVTMLEFGGGAIAADQITWLKDDLHPLHQCARSRMTIIGTQGAFEVNLETRSSSLLTGSRFQMIDTVLLGNADYYGCLKLQFEGFLRSVQEGAAVRASVEDALQAEMVALAAHRSLTAGREVTPL